MNVTETEKLKEYYEKLYEQFMLINLLGSDLIYLFPKDNSYHEHVFASQLFNRLIEGLKVNFALRLNIFLDEDEHFNIVSFIRRLLQRQKKAEWNQYISKSELQNFGKQIEDIIASNEFQTIRHIRNKSYAHFDKKAEDTELFTTQDEVMKKIEVLKDIMSKIGSKIFGTYYKMEFMHWDIDHNIISELSNYHEVCDNVHKLKYDINSKDISVDEIEKWLTKY